MSKFPDIPQKMSLSQIEHGEKLLQYLEDVYNMKNDLTILIDRDFTQKVIEFNKKLTTLENNFVDLQENITKALNKISTDLTIDIIDIRSNFRKLSEPIKANDLDDKLTELHRSMIGRIEKLESAILGGSGGGEIEPPPEDEEHYVDKNGITRKINFDVYFEAGSNKTIYLSDLPDFQDDLSKSISVEDWYGTRYEDGDYSNYTTELIYYGPTGLLLPDEFKEAENRYELAVKNIKENNIVGTYVPKTGIDIDTEKFPPIDYFVSASYNLDTKAIIFKGVGTTDFLFRLIKYY